MDDGGRGVGEPPPSDCPGRVLVTTSVRSGRLAGSAVATAVRADAPAVGGIVGVVLGLRRGHRGRVAIGGGVTAASPAAPPVADPPDDEEAARAERQHEADARHRGRPDRVAGLGQEHPPVGLRTRICSGVSPDVGAWTRTLTRLRPASASPPPASPLGNDSRFEPSSSTTTVAGTTMFEVTDIGIRALRAVSVTCSVAGAETRPNWVSSRSDPLRRRTGRGRPGSRGRSPLTSRRSATRFDGSLAVSDHRAAGWRSRLRSRGQSVRVSSRGRRPMSAGVSVRGRGRLRGRSAAGRWRPAGGTESKIWSTVVGVVSELARRRGRRGRSAGTLASGVQPRWRHDDHPGRHVGLGASATSASSAISWWASSTGSGLRLKAASAADRPGAPASARPLHP